MPYRGFWIPFLKCIDCLGKLISDFFFSLERKSFSVTLCIKIILKHLEFQFHLIQQTTAGSNIAFLNINEKFIMKSVRVMLAYQKPEFGSYILLQLMKYTLKSRHLITLKACSAK